MAATLTVSLSVTVEASRQRVFAAMTDPEQVAEWWGPERLHLPRGDPRRTRGWRVSNRDAPTEGEIFYLVGAYVEVDPPSRLAYTFRWEPPDPDDRETTARLTLRDMNGATEVQLTQGPFATEARRVLHQAGWAESLGRLVRYLAPT